MDEFLDIAKNYSLLEIVAILVAVYVSGKWVYEQISNIKQKFQEKLNSYHNQETSKEEKENKTEERFVSIEEKLNSDYIRIQKAESHLYEITETVKNINENFAVLKKMITDSRLSSLRSEIVNFAQVAMDLTHPQSKERYNNMYKIHAEFVQLNKDLGNDEDEYEKHYFEMIIKSCEQRTIQKLFAEDFYLPPSMKHSDAIVDPDKK